MDDDGYEPTDPKSEGFYDRAVEVWDNRDKTLGRDGPPEDYSGNGDFQAPEDYGTVIEQLQAEVARAQTEGSIPPLTNGQYWSGYEQGLIRALKILQGER